MRKAKFYFSISFILSICFFGQGFAKNICFEEAGNNVFLQEETMNCSYTVSAIIKDASCESGGSVGEIDLTVAGATNPVTYLWSNGAITEDVTALDPGVYAVTITDGTGCEEIEYYQVTSGTGQEYFDYFIPLPEADIRSSFYQFTSVWAPWFYLSNDIRSIISVVVTEDNSIITYDHWEDGQESDIQNPSQITTQIWGDGNINNGVAPGFSTDILSVGDAIKLDNSVYFPRSASSIKFDGRDHISSNAQLAVSRAAWGREPGPVLSGAVEILEKNAYGLEFQVPIGEDVSSDEMFEYVGLSVMAAENFTLVEIDVDGNGSTDVTRVLNMGETYFVDGGIQSGAQINATRPVQAHLMTGDINALFEARWFTLFPCELWDDCYYSPIGSTAATDPVDVFVYNPGGSSLTVFYQNQLGTGNFSVPAKGTYRYRMPMNSGAHFYTQNNKPFFALSTIDSDIQIDNDAHDWGFTLMPESYLTVSATIGWGPGDNGNTGNGSPAWVTATNATTLYVDYDGDPATGPLVDGFGNRYNASYDLKAFESRRIFDTNDNDQTGMYLYTSDGTLIAVAWGQDPATAAPGNPFLDFGTSVPPIRKIHGWKDYSIYTDNDNDGRVDPGDVIEFTLNLQNSGNSPVAGITITDELPGEITYISSTTTLNNGSVPDDGSGTPFPIDELGFYISKIPVNETYTITYRTMANAMPPVYSEIINGFTAFITDPCKTIVGEIIVPVETPPATSSCDLFLANVGGGEVSSFQINSDVCFQLIDSDQNNNTSSAETVQVTLENAATNDTETVTLTETGNSTGIFTGCISSSTTLGFSDEDGIFYATEGSSISSSFTDGTNGDMCSDNAVFEAESFIKQLYLTATNGLDRVDPVSTNDATTVTSPTISNGNTETFTQSSAMCSDLDMPAGGEVSVEVYINEVTSSGPSGAVAFDNQTTNVSTTETSVSFPHTTGSDADRYMIVGVTLSTSGAGPSTISYGGQALTSHSSRTFNDLTVQQWRLLNPPSGTHTLDVNFIDPPNHSVIGVATFSGVNQASPFTDKTNSRGTSTVIANTVSSSFGELVFETTAYEDNSVGTLGPDQTSVWSIQTGSNFSSGASYAPGDASITTTRTLPTSSAWVMAATSLYPSATINPNRNISAVLKKDGNIFNVLTNPTLSAGKLTWNSVLGSDLTVSAGEVISVEIVNDEPGFSFEIEYDSETKPSQINLPTTTVIKIEDFAIYDAPYPGGNIKTDFEADGTTVFIRATASDPFGTADITEIDFEAEAPGGGKINYDGIAVDSSGCEKTFEYAWTIPSATGIYNLSAFAKEGYEQTVIDTVKTTITINPPDPTAPCDLTFIDQDGNSTANFIIEQTVCIRLEDANTNSDDFVQESIVVTLTTNSGDAENINLIETGVATGVFENCIASTISSGSQQDGTLNAVESDVIHVTHIIGEEDCSAFANVLTEPTQIKVLYLSEPGQGLDRIDPVATNDLTTSNSGALTVSGGTININASEDTYFIDSSPDNNYGTSSNFQIGTFSSGTENRAVLKFDVSSLSPSDIGTVNLVVEMKAASNAPVNIDVYKLDTDWAEGTVTWDSPWTSAGADFGTKKYGSGVIASDFTLTEPRQYLTINITSLVREWVNGTSPNYGLILTSDDIVSSINCNAREAGAGIDPYLEIITGNTQSFEMETPFCLDFNILGGEQITVSTDVNILSGTMPANPNITASLYIIDDMGNFDRNIANITSPSYSGGKLTWSGGLSGGIIETVAIGEKIGLEISNNESGVNFEIAYDSRDFPSAINLPTNTVIETGSLGIYQNPYPDNTLISSLTPGDSAYIRTAVTDPFGAYDINYVDLEITSPSGSLATTRLDDSYVSNQGNCAKIYEYLWVTPAEEGEYIYKAIAQEGYENVQDSLITTATISRRDFGTNCVIEFLDNTDTDRITYDPNEQICLQISDFDKNVDATVVENILITLRSDAGDFETITLTETGVNTGIFKNCINASASVTGANEDGQIYAPSVSILYAEYIDTNDGTDICTQQVSINSLVPAVAINKTLVTPNGANALPGETITFQINVTNPGPTELTTVFVGDVFDNACMSYQSASITPDYAVGDSLNWTNIGPIPSGENETISVTFSATAACDPARNVANTRAVDENAINLSAGPDTAQLIIANPLIMVEKTIIAPLAANISVGDQVTYEIKVTNTGNTTITTLPVFDSYSNFCQSYVSSSIAADDTGGGTLLWNDLGPLAPNGELTFTVVLEAINACSPALNTVEIFYAVDEYGNPVPPVVDDAEIPVIVPPIAVNDYETTTENVAVDIRVPSNDYDFNFDLDLTSVDMTGLLQPDDGTITAIDPTTGEITYMPDNGFVGNDTFVYQICDLTLLCDTATVFITIEEAPVEICGDGIDNDGDTLFDCDDPDCAAPIILTVTPLNPTCPSLDNGSITIGVSGSNLEYSVDNGVNYQTSGVFNDLLEGEYDIIVRNSVTGCFARYSGNSITLTEPFCTEICNDGIDNDGDTMIDCADPDCANLTLNITKDTLICDGDAKLLEVEMVNCANACTGASVSSFPYYTSFENSFDNWTQMSGDDFDWRLRTGGTPSGGTGPSGASAGSYYIYVEASTPNYSNKTTGLISPCFNLLDYGGATLTFDYQMTGAGSGPGDLEVEITTDDGANWTSIWTVSGDQGTAWQDATVSLDAYIGNIIKLRLVGTTGTTWSGDIALDDLSVMVTDFTYLWSDGSMSATTLVSPNTTTNYTVTVTDALGNENTNSVEVSVKSCAEICNDNIDNDGDGQVDCLDGDCGNPTLLSVTPTNPANCPDLDDGQIVIAGSGVNLEYSIDNGLSFQSSNTFTGLSGGNYNIVIQNSVTGCAESYLSNPVVLLDPNCIEICNDGVDNDGDTFTDCLDPDCSGALTISTIPNNDICEGTGGTIDVSVAGTAPFTYVWSDMIPDARWDFDESSNDVSGNGNNKNFNGSLGLQTYSTSAKEGTHAVYFNGGDYIRYSQDGGFMESAFAEMSFSVWIKPDNLSGVKTIFEEGNNTAGIALRLNGNLLEGGVRSGGTLFSSGSVIVPNDGDWHHVTLVFDNGRLTVYLDGASGSTTVASYSSVASHSGDGGLGYKDNGDAFGAGSGDYFIGYMDDARYYFEKALSSSQVLDIAQNDGNRTALVSGTYSVTVTNGAFCKMSETETETISNLENIDRGGTVEADQSICNGDTPSPFTNTELASGGTGGAISYQWEVSSDNSNWSDISGATGLTYAPGTLTQTTYYRRGAYRDGCPSRVSSNVVTITVIDNLVDPGSILGGESKCGSYNPTAISSVTAASGGFGGSIEYQWQSSPNGSTGWEDILGAESESFDPPVVASTTYFRRGARRNSCSGWLYTNIILKTVVINYINGGTIGSDEAKCSAFDPEVITSSAVPSGGSSGSLAYVWEQNVNGGGWSTIGGAVDMTYDPSTITQTTEYRRGARRSPCSDFIYSNTITKTVVNFTSANISSFPTGDLCENVTYSFASADAGTGVDYNWNFGAFATPETATGQGPHTVVFDVPDADPSTDFEIILNTTAGLCSAADTVDASVIPNLSLPNVTGVNPTECGAMDGEINFFIAAPTGTDFEISIDGGNSFGTPNQTIFTGLAAGTYQVQLRYVGGNCPVDWGVVALEDPFLPTSAIFQDYTTECNGETFEFEALFNFFIGSYAWDFGADATPATATGRGPHFVTYSTTGLKTATLTVSGFGCSKDYNELFFLTENFTDGGSISADQDLCSTTDPAELTASASPSGGGTGTPDYQWEYRIDDGTGVWDDWVEIIGATGETYDPASVTELTQFRRKARNLPCTDWLFSNSVTIISAGTPIVRGDTYSSVCPGNSFGEDLTLNDLNLIGAEFSVHTEPQNGVLTLFEDGQFLYVPNSTFCGTDQFIYEVCNSGGSCCDTAIVNLNLTDTEKPVFVNIPDDVTISCDEEVPTPPSIVANENCLSVSISMDEISTQGIAGCPLHDYQITRIWTATDYCGNSSTASQVITVEDVTAPDIYRVYTLPNGKKMVAGIMENVSTRWKQIALPTGFVTIPVIFTQVVSDNDMTGLGVRLRNISTSQFEMQITEEEAADGLHGRESIAWIAIEEGAYTSGDGFEVGTVSLTSSVTNQPFVVDFGVVPGFISSVQTFVETDPIQIAFENLTGSGVDLSLREETSNDAEVSHLDESSGYMVIRNQGDFKVADDEIAGETGIFNVTTSWQSVAFAHSYNNPVVVANSPSSNDPDPVFVRIKDISSTGFQIKLQEWDYQDGVHAAEDVTWMVVEGSIPFDFEVACDSVPNPLETGVDLIAIDNCDFTLSLEYTEVPNTTSCTPGNEIIRTWTATDDCGNSVMLSRSITVIDTVPPEFTVPEDVTITCAEDIDDLVRIGDVTDESDNCAAGLEATYSDIYNTPFNCDDIYVVERNWTLTDLCGNSVTKTQYITYQSIGFSLSAKVKLQGAMFNNAGDGLMRDDLRKFGLIPLTEPYAENTSFVHRNEGGFETVDPSVFDVTGSDAIVDWVFVEIRDENSPDSIVATRSGLLQRDGDIVDVDGSSPLSFYSTLTGNYYVSIRHRNHLGIMTAESILFSENTTNFIDFTDSDQACWGTTARHFDGVDSWEMWGGDYNSNGSSVAQGFNNDANYLALTVFGDENNVTPLPNFIVQTYEGGDFDLNGQTIFQGPDNDLVKLQFYVILTHPLNTGSLANFIIYEQLP